MGRSPVASLGIHAPRRRLSGPAMERSSQPAEARADSDPAEVGAGSAEELFLSHLPVLNRIIEIICARHGLTGADAEDFGGWVRLRVMQDDYAVLRKFEGRSSIATYLTAVVANLYRDHRVKRRGRWRASAAAKRLGPVAERLERLVYRRRMTFREAVKVLRSEGATSASDRELAELFDRIPMRPKLRPTRVGPEPLERLSSDSDADAVVEAKEARRKHGALREALGRALEDLPAEDRVILRMRFWDETTVADIARALDLPQKPLYRRIKRLLGTLRERLEAEGVEAERVLSTLGTVSLEPGEFGESGPSIKETGSSGDER